MLCHVVPHAGTWIEIDDDFRLLIAKSVVPHAGTWIEIACSNGDRESLRSFPTRERGLKFLFELYCFSLATSSFPTRERGLKSRRNRQKREMD